MQEGRSFDQKELIRVFKGQSSNVMAKPSRHQDEQAAGLHKGSPRKTSQDKQVDHAMKDIAVLAEMLEFDHRRLQFAPIVREEKLQILIGLIRLFALEVRLVRSHRLKIFTACCRCLTAILESTALKEHSKESFQPLRENANTITLDELADQDSEDLKNWPKLENNKVMWCDHPDCYQKGPQQVGKNYVYYCVHNAEAISQCLRFLTVLEEWLRDDQDFSHEFKEAGSKKTKTAANEGQPEVSLKNAFALRQEVHKALQTLAGNQQKPRSHGSPRKYSVPEPLDESSRIYDTASALLDFPEQKEAKTVRLRAADLLKVEHKEECRDQLSENQLCKSGLSLLRTLDATKCPRDLNDQRSVDSIARSVDRLGDFLTSCEILQNMNRREHDPLNVQPVPVTIELLGEVHAGEHTRLSPLSFEIQEILKGKGQGRKNTNDPLPRDPLREKIRAKASNLDVQVEAESISVELVRSSVWIADLMVHPPQGGWRNLQHRVQLATQMQTKEEEWSSGETLEIPGPETGRGRVEVKYRIWRRERGRGDLLACDGFWNRAIVGVVKVILENSARTIQPQRDEQRARFSKRLVGFLARCQREPALASAFEDPLVQLHAAQILHTQSKNSVPASSCTGFDRTRAAGSARMLARSLEQEYPDSATFDPYSKVSYRIVSRVADVLQGRLSGEEGKTIQDLARAEADMWDLEEMQMSTKTANDHFGNEVQQFISDPDARPRREGQEAAQFAPDARFLQIIAKHVRKVASASESCIDNDQQRAIQQRLAEYSKRVKEQGNAQEPQLMKGAAERPDGGLSHALALGAAPGNPRRSDVLSKDEPEEAKSSKKKKKKTDNTGSTNMPPEQTHTEILLESLQRHESLGASGNVELFAERPSEIHGSDLRRWQLVQRPAAEPAVSSEQLALPPGSPGAQSTVTAGSSAVTLSPPQARSHRQVQTGFWKLNTKSIQDKKGDLGGRKGLLESHFTEAEDYRSASPRGGAAAHDQPFEVMDEVETMDGVAFLKLAHKMDPLRGDLFAKKAECEQYMDILDGSGRLNGVYSVVAFLRILYMLLNMPQSPQLRAKECGRLVRNTYSTPHAFLDLLAMASNSVWRGDSRVGALSCNVVAKLLRVVTCLLKVDHCDENAAVSEKKLELFAIMSKYIDRLSRSMLQVLRLTNTGYLKEREQILCAELTAFFREAVRALAAIEEPKGQKQGTDTTSRHDGHRERVNFWLQWLVPESALELLVGVVLYDLRTNSLGRAAHPSLNHGFVQNMSELKGRMAADATGVLCRLMAADSKQSLGQAAGFDYKYFVLERLNSADVFDHQVLRSSYLFQLLEGAKSWEVAGEVEKRCDDPNERQEKGSYGFFARHSSKGGQLPLDRLTQVLICEQVSTSDAPSAYLCCTVQEIALVAVAKERPQDLKFKWKAKYTDVERIFRCYGSQAIVFMFKDSGRSSKLSKLAFYRDTVRDEVIALVEKMRANAGEGSSDGFHFVVNATGMKKEIMNLVKDAKVVAATITSGGPEQPGETMLWTLSVPVTCLMQKPQEDTETTNKTILMVVPIQGLHVGDRILISSGSQGVTRHIMSFRKVILEEPLTQFQISNMREGATFETQFGFLGAQKKIKGKLTKNAVPKSDELQIKIDDFEKNNKPDVLKDPKKRDKSWSEFTSGVNLSFTQSGIVVKVKFFDELVVDEPSQPNPHERVKLRNFPADARVIKLEGRMDNYRLVLDSWEPPPPDYLPEKEEDNPQEYFGVEIFPKLIKKRYKETKARREEEKMKDQQKTAVVRMREQMSAAFVKEEAPVLTWLGTYTLPPKQVVFEHGPEPELTLAFPDPQGGSAPQWKTIRFLDDAGRERWRHALAWFIAKCGSGWRRED